MKFKNVLLITLISLFVFACGKVPEAPEAWLCAHDSAGTGFYCVNTRDTKKTKILRDDTADMHGAQCMSLDDYSKMQDYYKMLVDLAEKKCK